MRFLPASGLSAFKLNFTMGDLTGAKADTVAAEASRQAVKKIDILVESCNKT
jgi:hypothetical protein